MAMSICCYYYIVVEIPSCRPMASVETLLSCRSLESVELMLLLRCWCCCDVVVVVAWNTLHIKLAWIGIFMLEWILTTFPVGGKVDYVEGLCLVPRNYWQCSKLGVLLQWYHMHMHSSVAFRSHIIIVVMLMCRLI